MIAIEGLQKRYNTNTELARDSVTFIFVHHAIRTIKGNLTELRFNRTCKCNKINVSMSFSKIFLKNVAFFMFVCVFFFFSVQYVFPVVRGRSMCRNATLLPQVFLNTRHKGG